MDTQPDAQVSMTVLINPGGGMAARANAIPELQDLLRTHVPLATVELLKQGVDPAERARAACASGAKIVVAAGGDGTINAVAQALVGSEIWLGIVPYGTLNHFARTVGIPIQPDQAVELLAHPVARRVDVGRVNDRFFLNNVSIGIYPQLVRIRENQDTARAKPIRWLRSVWHLLHTGRPIRLEVVVPEQRLASLVWVVFIGNNHYSSNILQAGQRRSLDQGLLDLVVIPARRRWGIARVLVASGHDQLTTQRGSRMDVDQVLIRPAAQAACATAIDGEVVILHPPLHFSSERQALQVIMPADEGA